MPEHSSSRFPQGTPTNARTAKNPLSAAEITDIIPFNEFGDLHELEFRDSSAFDKEQRVIAAPELDDLHDTDDLVPLRLAVPTEFESHEPRPSARGYRDSHTDLSDGLAQTDVIDIRGQRIGGAHRKQTVGAVKSRLLIAAMAAGATASGAYTLSTADSSTATSDTVLTGAQAGISGGVITGSADGMQIVTVEPAASSAVHAEEITKAAAFAQERAEREARLNRPLFVMPTKGVWTSGFGYRWGVLHAGIDIAGPIGTPIVAVADGTVIDAGPTAGYGAWVKIRHNDGTVTLYGHVNTWLVSVGQRVMAGDQIATIGNRGNSTGPHCHFEVLLNGSNRIDPVPWLAQRGLSPGTYVG
ncbi:M23 family metallopeptidase [Mycolicibacterium fluoranthenivorans]|uniref:Murein DD-endopeptidase MepM/ murein hydrolase activator NlpD n=1 Tax=Mycolicibacterium fluoranthenivorans TaxID=258505 RepID=A0A7X5ZGD0_9MYCO|nr:M23 family metallopeptidase [Mycolicibacterium fluoranthenivorans]MCV7358994.1 M23 family metallopeptidase [Mycolicibacterium fluoranthenivorans]NIH98997.1 murein DD-endopeptidase MepM/ murein hydrolase activator NlpD [Mycolicibacterium fluoranthenivorans]